VFTSFAGVKELAQTFIKEVLASSPTETGIAWKFWDVSEGCSDIKKEIYNG